jgi:hypothetical protein
MLWMQEWYNIYWSSGILAMQLLRALMSVALNPPPPPTGCTIYKLEKRSSLTSRAQFSSYFYSRVLFGLRTKPDIFLLPYTSSLMQGNLLNSIFIIICTRKKIKNILLHEDITSVGTFGAAAIICFRGLFNDAFGMQAIQRRVIRSKTNCKGFGRKRLWPICGTIPPCAWREWGKPRKPRSG